MEPSVRLDNPWIRLSGEAELIVGPTGSRSQGGSLGFIGETPSWNGFRLSATSSYDRMDVLPGFSPTRAASDLALSYGRRQTGAWLGLGSERSFAREGYYGNALLRAGLWQQIGRLSIALSSESHGSRDESTVFIKVHDTLNFGADTMSTALRTVSHARRWSEVEARLSWTWGRAVIDGHAGVQQSTDSAPSMLWARAAATVGISSHLSLVGAFGTRPSRAWVGSQSSRFATLGVRIAPATLARPAAPPHVQPAAQQFAIRAAESGTFIVSVRVPYARTVEISGDFNQWAPVALHETQPDVWEGAFPLAPGSHRVNLRVNGAQWVAPPGLTSTNDDFNGSVGILVVPSRVE